MQECGNFNQIYSRINQVRQTRAERVKTQILHKRKSEKKKMQQSVVKKKVEVQLEYEEMSILPMKMNEPEGVDILTMQNINVSFHFFIYHICRILTVLMKFDNLSLRIASSKEKLYISLLEKIFTKSWLRAIMLSGKYCFLTKFQDNYIKFSLKQSLKLLSILTFYCL